MAKRRRPETPEGFKQSRNRLKSGYFKPRPTDRPAAAGPAGRAERAEEAKLLRAAKGGDPGALRTLLTHVSKPAFRYGMSFCRDREDAEEIAQDVLASLVRSLESYRGEASLSTWAYTVARRACIRRRRRAPIATESLDAWNEDRRPEPADPAGGPETGAERRELRAAVETAIRALPPALREAVILRDVEGLSAREAAGVLGLSERSFKSRLHRARLALRQGLAPFVDSAAFPSADAAGTGRRRCPDIARYLSLHQEGDVSASLCARLESHVRGCPACAATCRSVRATLRACSALRAKPLSRGARAALRAALTRPKSALGATR